MDAIRFEWRGAFGNEELNLLHGRAFGYAPLEIDWWGQVQRHSLGWVTARQGDRLLGFVNVPWDGGIHAFVMDTIVMPEAQRRGIGTGLVAEAVVGARAAGCHHLHVDFEEHLRSFYFDACGFRTTPAGLIPLL